MASALRIVDLNGRSISIIKGATQSWADVVSKANLPKRFDFCVRHWMSDNPSDVQVEDRVKAYLDRVGYILIQDKPDAKIITDYKEARDKIALIPVSGVPQLANLFYSQADDETVTSAVERESSDHMTKVEKKIYGALTRPRYVPEWVKKQKEKRKRIDAVRERYPKAEISFAVVDTVNEFTYEGQRWRIDDLPQYRAKSVRGDDLYDMDRVVCVKAEDSIQFYDQDYNSITGHVHAA